MSSTLTSLARAIAADPSIFGPRRSLVWRRCDIRARLLERFRALNAAVPYGQRVSGIKQPASHAGTHIP